MSYSYKDSCEMEDELKEAHLQLARAKDVVTGLIDKWQKDAEQYLAQCDEARSKKLPHEMMNATAITLRGCAHELERAIKK